VQHPRVKTFKQRGKGKILLSLLYRSYWSFSPLDREC
jgi:hypothetical protein